jgi:hypothetical protein
MPKKREGLGSKLWKAWSYLAIGFLHLLYLSSKALVWAATLAARKIFEAAKKRAQQHSMQPSSHSPPAYSQMVLEKKLSGELGEFEEKLLSSQSTVGIILGSRGSGKSALGMRILENVASRGNRRVCAMGFAASSLPLWITPVLSVEEVPNGSFVLFDEGGITFSSRSSGSSANKILSSFLLVSRHKDLSILFISQNSANLEVNAIRQADYLLLRKPSLLQQEFERRIIGKIYGQIAVHFGSLADGGRYATYVHSDQFRGFAASRLPSFWSQKASKSFSAFDAAANKGKGK